MNVHGRIDSSVCPSTVGCGGLLIVLLLAAAPLAAQEWFDDYERGLQALRQGQGARAAELLERAARKRPEPGTNLITYGTNRLDRYHPYLRLAEAYLLAGRPEAARESLKRSGQHAKEPAAERARIAEAVETALERARVAGSPPPVTLAAAPTPGPAPAVTGPPPTTLAAAATPAPAVALPQAITTPVVALGTLEIRSSPAGATVLSRGNVLGTTPLIVDLPAGTYQITLRRAGSAEESFPVLVQAGQRALVTRTLLATGPEPSGSPPPTAAEVASLVVYSVPAGASVYLDDEPLGGTDPASGRLVKSGVAPGPHRLRLAHGGHEDLAQQVEVAPSGPTTFRGTLMPAARRDLTPVFAGLAVAVAAASGLLAWRKRRARPESVPGTRVLGAGPPRTVTLGTPSPRRTAISSSTAPSPTAGHERETAPLPAGTKVGAASSRFGDYRLLEQIGKGGMASVFKAERNGELCALKRPLGVFLDDPEFMVRFLREAEIGRTLHHPNIIRIFERGQVEGVPYFTMELVSGETLQSLIRREGARPPREAARLVAQVAEALDYAHLKGVVHRDLKPSNIMVLAEGTVKVMDYGIARARRFEGLTVTGAFLGTPDYVAPETAEGRTTDARSDLYSLGIVFYETLTGQKPFVAETPFATLRKHCTEAPTPPSLISPGVPRELEAIILRLLRKSPEERYPGAEELLIELREYLNRAA